MIGTNAKISDLEFAKRRGVGRLEELTRPVDPSLPVVEEIRAVGSFGSFMDRTDPVTREPRISRP